MYIIDKTLSALLLLLSPFLLDCFGFEGDIKIEGYIMREKEVVVGAIDVRGNFMTFKTVVYLVTVEHDLSRSVCFTNVNLTVRYQVPSI